MEPSGATVCRAPRGLGRLASRLGAAAGRGSAVLVLHACLPGPPEGPGRSLHNVTPTDLEAFVRALKATYTFVFVDELFRARRQRGLAAITFDDGYKSVVEHALPVLSSLDVPCTIFVNGATVDRKVFWRDKVRHVMARGLVERFEATLAGDPIRRQGPFYRYTKDPRNNGRLIDRRLDEFLGALNEPGPPNECFDDVRYFRRHRLVSYGSHSFSHYVMASLSEEDQFEEIDRNERLLRSVAVERSAVFSLPFGGSRHLNRDTVRLLADRGYTGLVLATGRLNRDIMTMGVPALDRILPVPCDPPGLPPMTRWLPLACGAISATLSAVRSSTPLGPGRSASP